MVNLKVPKLRKITFETATIERYRRREASVEEALIEMYLAGISGKWGMSVNHCCTCLCVLMSCIKP